MWGLPNDGIRGAVYLPAAILHGVELAANRPREARPRCEDELSRGARRGGTDGGFRVGDWWERVVDFGEVPRLDDLAQIIFGCERAGALDVLANEAGVGTPAP